MKKIVYRILFVLYLAAVFTLCLMQFDPSSELPRTFLGIEMDKIVHFVMFMPFPFLFWQAFHKRQGKPYTLVGCILLALTFGLIMGGGIEILQGLVRRCPDIRDFRANALGLLVTCMGILVYSARTKQW